MLNVNQIKLDIKSNRKTKNYSKKILLKRVIWGIVKCFFRFSPRTFFAFRNMLLRMFGAKIGKNVHIYNSAIIYMPWNLEIGDWSAIGEWSLIYNLAPVKLGSYVTISHGAQLCAGTHDYEELELPLMPLPIEIKSQVWVCSQAFIGPGIIVGEGSVVGARAVVMKDVESWSVMAGNPAKFIKKRIINS